MNESSSSDEERPLKGEEASSSAALWKMRVQGLLLLLTPSSWSAFFLTIGMLVSGTLNTVSKSIQNETESKGLLCKIDPECQQVHFFHHPWFQTLVMFCGESVCLVGFFFMRFYLLYQQRQQAALMCDVEVEARVEEKETSLEKRQYADLSTSSDGAASSVLDAAPFDATPPPPPPLPHPYLRPDVFSFIFALPMFCDLLGTTLGGIGLIYTPASVWQMLRGSIIIFSGILSVIFLKRRLTPYNWVGMVIVVCGLAIVGVAGFFTALELQTLGANSGALLLLGIVLVLAGQLANSVQFIIEEKFLKLRNYAPLHVVGMEGIFGAFVMAFFVLPLLTIIPGKQYGSYENSIDAFVQIANSTTIAVFVVVYFFSITFYNFFSLSIAKQLTTIHRTLIDASRTILVWLVDLFIYYALKLHEYGEEFTAWSWLELVGFGVLLLGTVTYNGVLRWPCFTYPAPSPPPPVVVVVAEDAKEGKAVN